MKEVWRRKGICRMQGRVQTESLADVRLKVPRSRRERWWCQQAANLTVTPVGIRKPNQRHYGKEVHPGADHCDNRCIRSACHSHSQQLRIHHHIECTGSENKRPTSYHIIMTRTRLTALLAWTCFYNCFCRAFVLNVWQWEGSCETTGLGVTPPYETKPYSKVPVVPSLILSAALALSFPMVSGAVSGGGLDYANLDITGQDFSNANFKGKDFTQGTRH